jgi:hypothetical protein
MVPSGPNPTPLVDASNPAAPVERGSLKMRGGILTIALASANTLVTSNLVSLVFDVLRLDRMRSNSGTKLLSSRIR